VNTIKSLQRAAVNFDLVQGVEIKSTTEITNENRH
jgi:hypothetical protein